MKTVPELPAKKLNIGLICGGTSGEHEVSLISAYNIQAALDREKYNVLLIGIDKNGGWFLGNTPEFLQNVKDVRKVDFAKKLPTRLPQKNLTNAETSGSDLAKVDVFFPITHGKLGEDGALQGLLELLGKPYVGADVYGSAICMDKDVSKRLLREHGIPVAKFRTIRNPAVLSFEEAVLEMGTPLFVKPCREGSSLGVSKVRTVEEYEAALWKAFAADRKVLVEEAISGREIECSVLGNKNPQSEPYGKPYSKPYSEPYAAPVLGEVIPRHEFYSYEAKYVDQNGAELSVPAKIAPEISEQIRKAAVAAFQVTECKSMARVDFFLRDDGSFILNEINTLPGFTNISMYPILLHSVT